MNVYYRNIIKSLLVIGVPMRFRIPGIVVPVITYLMAVLCSAVVTYVLVSNRQQADIARLDNMCMRQRNLLRTELERLLRKLEALGELVASSNGVPLNFENIASAFYGEPAILALALAPGNRISTVYPPNAFNGGLVGRRLMETRLGGPLNDEEQRTGKGVLIGPIHMRGGTLALVGRMPVHVKNGGDAVFWGHVVLVAHFELVLSGAEFSMLRNLGFAYEIWKTRSHGLDPEMVAMDGLAGTPRGPSRELSIPLAGTMWTLRLAIVKAWYEYTEIWLYIGLNILLTLVFVALVRENQRQARLRKILEDIAFRDPLTGALSRRGFIEEAERRMQKDSSPFTLLYLDVNKFKEINDTYGHEAGDRVLRLLVESVRDNAPPGHILGRIGGDEFVLLVPGASDSARWASHIDAALRALGNVHFSKGKSGPVTFSVGWAVYPEDGVSLDTLLSAADAKMYQHKLAGRAAYEHSV